MNKKDWFGIIYVSLIVVAWGTVGSIIDLPFLNNEIYLPGSLGQYATFTLTGAISVVLGIYFYPLLIAKWFDS